MKFQIGESQILLDMELEAISQVKITSSATSSSDNMAMVKAKMAASFRHSDVRKGIGTLTLHDLKKEDFQSIEWIFSEYFVVRIMFSFLDKSQLPDFGTFFSLMKTPPSYIFLNLQGANEKITVISCITVLDRVLKKKFTNQSLSTALEIHDVFLRQQKRSLAELPVENPEILRSVNGFNEAFLESKKGIDLNCPFDNTPPSINRSEIATTKAVSLTNAPSIRQGQPEIMANKDIIIIRLEKLISKQHFEDLKKEYNVDDKNENSCQDIKTIVSLIKVWLRDDPTPFSKKIIVFLNSDIQMHSIEEKLKQAVIQRQEEIEITFSILGKNYIKLFSPSKTVLSPKNNSEPASVPDSSSSDSKESELEDGELRDPGVSSSETTACPPKATEPERNLPEEMHAPRTDPINSETNAKELQLEVNEPQQSEETQATISEEGSAAPKTTETQSSIVVQEHQTETLPSFASGDQTMPEQTPPKSTDLISPPTIRRPSLSSRRRPRETIKASPLFLQEIDKPELTIKEISQDKSIELNKKTLKIIFNWLVSLIYDNGKFSREDQGKLGAALKKIFDLASTAPLQDGGKNNIGLIKRMAIEVGDGTKRERFLGFLTKNRSYFKSEENKNIIKKLIERIALLGANQKEKSPESVPSQDRGEGSDEMPLAAMLKKRKTAPSSAKGPIAGGTNEEESVSEKSVPKKPSLPAKRPLPIEISSEASTREPKKPRKNAVPRDKSQSDDVSESGVDSQPNEAAFGDKSAPAAPGAPAEVASPLQQSKVAAGEPEKPEVLTITFDDVFEFALSDKPHPENVENVKTENLDGEVLTKELDELRKINKTKWLEIQIESFSDNDLRELQEHMLNFSQLTRFTLSVKESSDFDSQVKLFKELTDFLKKEYKSREIGLNFSVATITRISLKEDFKIDFIGNLEAYRVRKIDRLEIEIGSKSLARWRFLGKKINNSALSISDLHVNFDTAQPLSKDNFYFLKEIIPIINGLNNLTIKIINESLSPELKERVTTILKEKNPNVTINFFETIEGVAASDFEPARKFSQDAVSVQQVRSAGLFAAPRPASASVAAPAVSSSLTVNVEDLTEERNEGLTLTPLTEYTVLKNNLSNNLNQLQFKKYEFNDFLKSLETLLGKNKKGPKKLVIVFSRQEKFNKSKPEDHGKFSGMIKTMTNLSEIVIDFEYKEPRLEKTSANLEELKRRSRFNNISFGLEAFAPVNAIDVDVIKLVKHETR
jgi:hypothetical protein